MNSEDTKKVSETANHKMDLSIKNLKQDLTGIHAGRVSPTMLETIKVDYYGNSTCMDACEGLFAY